MPADNTVMSIEPWPLTVAAGTEVGTVVAVVTASDPDGFGPVWGGFSLGNILHFRLEKTSESTWNLLVNGPLDHDTVPQAELEFISQDLEGNVDIFYYYVDIAAPPAQVVAISNNTISEGARTGTLLGTLSAVDPEDGIVSFSLAAGEGDNNSAFNLVTNSDGTYSIRLKSPLDYEARPDGIYNLVVDATDANGNVTRQTIQIQATDDPFKMTNVPTGKDYMSITEAAPAGTLLGFAYAFDESFTPTSLELVDDHNGLFTIVTRVVNGVTTHYLALNGTLDYETQDLYAVTLRASDANGVSHEKTFHLHVTDAAEAGDTARGAITIDAATLLAAEHGGINWNTYLQDKYDIAVGGLPDFSPVGSGWTPSNPSSAFLFALEQVVGGWRMALHGSDLVYNWVDPISGEDAHIVSGIINSIVFGKNNGESANPYQVDDAEVTISGLDISNDSGLLNRIFGEAQLLAQTFMNGNSSTPSDIEFVKALLAGYAQNFIGSAGDDTYTGTVFNDTIRGGGGDDSLDGGAGIDTVVFAGNASAYGVTENDDGSWTVTDSRSNGDGSDTLRDVEVLRFADREVVLGAVVNNAPVITSNGGGATAAITVAENQRAVTTVTATDADADTTLTYTISGGADAALFTIDARSGRLAFKSAPDHEAPKDAGRNNVYDVVVSVSDGDLSDSQALQIRVSDVNEAPVITSNGGGAAAAIRVAENGTAVTTARATD
ncbi:cadherin repeat domain-containing protein, partial [Gemmobacter serpentinus]|uniref:cadherin repeat domain-containing protein n=1 Tax=Gemmobacter serpentinus TaxID=2652247 RepID=UPI0018656F74